MKLGPTEIAGLHVIDVDEKVDERGSFARTWCADAARALGLRPYFEQASVSFNRSKGTLRGLHFQVRPHSETKLVRCTAGAIYDVVVDLRQESPTFRRWVAFELSSANRRSLYIPERCAHGFQTLTDDAEVYYQISPAYRADSASGVRWNDAAFRIAWPPGPRILSERDRSWPDFTP